MLLQKSLQSELIISYIILVYHAKELCGGPWDLNCWTIVFVFYRPLSGMSTLPNPRSSPIHQNWSLPSSSNTSTLPRRPVSDSDSDGSGTPPPRRQTPHVDSRYKYWYFYWICIGFSQCFSSDCSWLDAFSSRLQSPSWSSWRPEILSHPCSPGATEES